MQVWFKTEEINGVSMLELSDEFFSHLSKKQKPKVCVIIWADRINLPQSHFDRMFNSNHTGFVSIAFQSNMDRFETCDLGKIFLISNECIIFSECEIVDSIKSKFKEKYVDFDQIEIEFIHKKGKNNFGKVVEEKLNQIEEKEIPLFNSVEIMQTATQFYGLYGTNPKLIIEILKRHVVKNAFERAFDEMISQDFRISQKTDTPKWVDSVMKANKQRLLIRFFKSVKELYPSILTNDYILCMEYLENHTKYIYRKICDENSRRYAFYEKIVPYIDSLENMDEFGKKIRTKLYFMCDHNNLPCKNENDACYTVIEPKTIQFEYNNISIKIPELKTVKTVYRVTYQLLLPILQFDNGLQIMECKPDAACKVAEILVNVISSSDQ